jgi:hypothetical protein
MKKIRRPRHHALEYPGAVPEYRHSAQAPATRAAVFSLLNGRFSRAWLGIKPAASRFDDRLPLEAQGTLVGRPRARVEPHQSAEGCLEIRR